MSRPWCRLYTGSRHNADLTTLDPAVRLCWYLMLDLAAHIDKGGCLGLRHPVLSPVQKLAAECHLDELSVSTALQMFTDLRMLKRDHGDYRISKWADYQYESDSSTERVKRYRERHRNVTVTPQEQSRAEQIQSRAENARANPWPTCMSHVQTINSATVSCQAHILCEFEQRFFTATVPPSASAEIGSLIAANCAQGCKGDPDSAVLCTCAMLKALGKAQGWPKSKGLIAKILREDRDL